MCPNRAIFASKCAIQSMDGVSGSFVWLVFTIYEIKFVLTLGHQYIFVLQNQPLYEF